MTFEQWFFGLIDNPRVEKQWGLFHILTLVFCVVCIFAFNFIVKHSKNKQKASKIIIITLVSLILFFEIARRIMLLGRKYFYNDGTTLIWIMLPRPWCAIACWAIIASVIVNKKFFYNYASLSALLCSFIFFCYPGVGYNNQYMLFDNIYSIFTHALLLISSITLITLKFTEFRYKDFWKFFVCLILTYVYGFIEIYVLKIYEDPMYFMPNGDIQADILKISYGLYIVLYVLLILVYTNAFYLIQDRKNVKNYLNNLLKK